MIICYRPAPETDIYSVVLAVQYIYQHVRTPTDDNTDAGTVPPSAGAGATSKFLV
jgi:hypothetical protein